MKQFKEFPEHLIQTINKELNVNILDKCKKEKNVIGKRIFCVIMHDNFHRNIALYRIGNFIGLKQHGAVLNHLKNHTFEYDNYLDYMQLFDKINSLLKNEKKYTAEEFLKSKIGHFNKKHLVSGAVYYGDIVSWLTEFAKK